MAAQTDWTPAIGLQVRVTTNAGDVIEGEIFTFDANTNCVVIGGVLLPPHPPAGRRRPAAGLW